MSRATKTIADRTSSQQTEGTETGSAWLVENYSELTALVAVTAVSSAAPILEIKLQTSDDNSSSATWFDLVLPGNARIQFDGTGNKAATWTGFGKYVRTSREVSGPTSPTATYTIQLIAKT